MTWIMWHSVPSARLHDAELGEVADAPEACAAIQRHTKMLEKWADSDLMLLISGKYKVLQESQEEQF